MAIFFSWIIFSILVGMLGKSRKIGFGPALAFSLFLSPLVGLIITLLSKDIAEEQYKQELLNGVKQKAQTPNLEEELLKLKGLKEKGLISEEEHETLRAKVING